LTVTAPVSGESLPLERCEITTPAVTPPTTRAAEAATIHGHLFFFLTCPSSRRSCLGVSKRRREMEGA
jgi:hypothetical protein